MTDCFPRTWCLVVQSHELHSVVPQWNRVVVLRGYPIPLGVDTEETA